jgi:hypothetical protein
MQISLFTSILLDSIVDGSAPWTAKWTGFTPS